jgi:hypothetical protein
MNLERIESRIITILGSPKATETTHDVIETFDKVKELQHTVAAVGKQTDKGVQKNI